MSWVNPKLDWKETDNYNAEDLNRVENNTLEAANYLGAMQSSIPLEATKTDRVITSIDFISSLNRIERNIEIVKNSFLIPPGWQDKKVWALGMGFSYLDANRLENNLNLLYTWAQLAKDNLIYTGTFSCGTDWEGGLYG
jgi:hypothetical protein